MKPLNVYNKNKLNTTCDVKMQRECICGEHFVNSTFDQTNKQSLETFSKRGVRVTGLAGGDGDLGKSNMTITRNLGDRRKYR